MKKLFPSLLIAISLNLLSGCGDSELIEDVTNSYDNLREETVDVINSTRETIDDIENAVEEIHEAADAARQVID